MIGKQTQQIFIFSIISLLSYGVWKYYFDREKTVTDKPFTKGYSVENIELKITNEKGKLTAKFKSPSLIRYTDSPILYIKSPLFWLYKEGKEQWKMQSDKAEYNAESNQVGLYENLLAESANIDKQTSFVAKNLMLNLNNKKAYTADGVRITQQQQFVMTGQNAHFDLDNELLEVNNNVKAVYKSQFKTNNEKK
jgi:LPS export ABC transporter protein LptC